MHLNCSVDSHSQADVTPLPPQFHTPERRQTDRSHLLASPVAAPRMWGTEETSHLLSIPNVKFNHVNKTPVAGASHPKRRFNRQPRPVPQASWSPLPERSSYSSKFAGVLLREENLNVRKETDRFKRLFKKVQKLTQRLRTKLPRSFRVFSRALHAFQSSMTTHLLRPTGYLRDRYRRVAAPKTQSLVPPSGVDSIHLKRFPLRTLLRPVGSSPLCGRNSPKLPDRVGLLDSPQAQFSLVDIIQEVKPKATRGLNSETGIASDSQAPDEFLFWRDRSPQEKRPMVKFLYEDESSDSDHF